jgi:hypothetical protein
MTCRRSQEFLAERKTPVLEQVHAGKRKFSPAEAVKLAHSVRHVFVAKGKSLVHFDMQNDPPADAELKKHLIGPSGNLRAPTARAGDRLFVGFHPEEYAASLFGT